MIISPARSFVFVHIPKTGGTSLSLALEDRAHKDDILIGDTPKAQKRKRRLKDLRAKGRLWKHSTMADIEGAFEQEQLASMFKIALVRNPWDRMVSYYHWLQVQSFDHVAVKLAQELEFSAFVRHPHTRSSVRQNPYGRYLRDGTGVEWPTLFVRLENFHQDVAPFEEHLGFGIVLPLANKSERSTDYRDYFTGDLARITGEDCAEDIERFGYSF